MLLLSAEAARVSLGDTRPLAKEREEKRKHKLSYFDEAEVVSQFLKSVPAHAIDLKQIEPSYKVRLPWVYIQRSLSGTGNCGSTESKKSWIPMPKQSREELLASDLAAALKFRSQRGTSSTRERS